MKERITVSAIQAKKDKEKIVALTAYDYPTAKIQDAVGIDIVLVGDSLGMVVLGRDNTLSVTMQEMIHHTRAVSLACRRSMVVADLPFLSYGISETSTVRHSGLLIQRGGAHAVKLEGGKNIAPSVEKIVSIGIPVLGHIGMTPTHVHQKSGYKVQGREKKEQLALLEDARAIEAAGAFAVVLECVSAELAQVITASIRIPTIGIGAGPYCDGQILVAHDILGLYDGKLPRFVKTYANLHGAMENAFLQYSEEVRAGQYPSKDHCYK